MAHMLMKIMNKNMKKDMPYNHHSTYTNMPSKPNHMDRLNSLEKMMKNYFQQKNQYEEHNNFKSNYYNQDKYNMYDVAESRDSYRYKRQSGRHSLPNLDLGDRFEAKLQAEKERTNEKIGNLTCILQELNVLDKQNNIDVQAMKREFQQYTFPSAWFKQMYEELLDSCYQMATNLPANIENQYEVQGEVGSVNVAQIKTFVKCYAKARGQLCMNQDLKQQIETEFGDLEKILQKTRLTEHQLFSVVRSMLESQHDEFDFSM